jgi:GTP pyrophosphokinase
MLNRAYVYTVQKHGTQKRASGDPYFSHPVEVAGLMTELKLDQETIMTALLHDTVEDTLATVEEIERLFGPDVARLVDGVTKLSKIETMTESERAAENLRKFLLAMSEDLRPPRQAGRPPAQHAHAPLHQERGQASPHRARDDGNLRPARPARGHVRIYARDAASRLRTARTRSLCHDRGRLTAIRAEGGGEVDDIALSISQALRRRACGSR